MNFMSIRYFILFSCLLSMSCEEVPEFNEGDTVPVVEAFIYANERVQNIVLKEVIPFGSDNDEEVFIPNIDMEIVWNGDAFPLEEVVDRPGHYQYTGNALSINIGETYGLDFNFRGNLVTAETRVPEAPIGLNVSSNELALPQIEERRDLRNLIQSGNLEIQVEWENLGIDFHYLVIENIEENPEQIDLNDVLNFNFEFTSTPTQDNFFTLRPFVHFSQFGTHRVVLYRVNEEYALLYQSLEQDSRDLNEPFSNVTNGVGIFSAFASDTIYFEIVKQ